MAEAEIRLEFIGPAVAAGQMDARWVGQSLLAVSDLVTLVKNTDPHLRDADSPSLRVSAFEANSFDITFVLEAMSDAWEQLRTFGNSEDVTAVVQLGGLLGLVWATIKTFGGRRVTSQSTDESGDL